MAMTWDQIKQNWTHPDFVTLVKARFPRVIGNSIEETLGERDALVLKVKDSYGFTYQDAAIQVDEWAANVVPLDPAKLPRQPVAPTRTTIHSPRTEAERRAAAEAEATAARENR